MPEEKIVQCNSCKHNLKTSSCADKDNQLISNIFNNLGIRNIESEEKNNQINHTCKILLRYPEDFKLINPYKCKYYMPIFFRMY